MAPETGSVPLTGSPGPPGNVTNAQPSYTTPIVSLFSARPPPVSAEHGVRISPERRRVQVHPEGYRIPKTVRTHASLEDCRVPEGVRTKANLEGQRTQESFAYTTFTNIALNTLSYNA